MPIRTVMSCEVAPRDARTILQERGTGLTLSQAARQKRVKFPSDNGDKDCLVFAGNRWRLFLIRFDK
jgi:hypothetical protein